jgi:hypothetical protein
MSWLLAVLIYELFEICELLSNLTMTTWIPDCSYLRGYKVVRS